MEHKFRAWIEEQEEMVDVVELVFEDGDIIGAVLNSEHETIVDYLGENQEPITETHSYYEVGEFTLMQYTGLKDKNGVDLDWWEGDILQDDNGFVFQMVYVPEYMMYLLLDLHRPDLKNYYRVGEDYAIEDLKKIGNIHQNPELLEAKK